jgi:predicted nucleic acid-binding protein
MDCLIAASAAALNGILLTEDNDLKNRLQNIPETKLVPTWSWHELVNKII